MSSGETGGLKDEILQKKTKNTLLVLSTNDP